MARLVVAGALLWALLSLAACGGGDDARRANAGTLTMLAGSDVDFLDPGHTYFALGLQVALATQRPLYGYAPRDLSLIHI